MDRLVNRVNEIADSDSPRGGKPLEYMVAAFDTEIAELIRRDRNGEPGLLRELGFVDIADALRRYLGSHEPAVSGGDR